MTNDDEVAKVVGSWNPTLMIGVFIPVPFPNADTSVPALFRIELNMHVALRGIRVLDSANTTMRPDIRNSASIWYVVTQSQVESMVGLFYATFLPTGGTSAPNFVTRASVNGSLEPISVSYLAG